MKATIPKIWIDDEAIYIRTDKGEVYRELFSEYSKLREASPAQRANYEFDNIGIHWEDLDEDLSYRGFMNK
ncbi:MAG: DUF2442 domain-containing protein [Tannerella sp.]|jgi:hypothetical protein|nr:DUF2442 domain-containing protein [Tannerella sp.]